MRTSLLLLILIILNPHSIYPQKVITNLNGDHFGNNFLSVARGKTIALKENRPFILTPFEHSEMFILTDNDTSQTSEDVTQQTTIEFSYLVKQVIPQNIYNTVKQSLDFKYKDVLKQDLTHWPSNAISIAVHIRKGNGGSQHYDGNLAAPQIYNFDRNIVKYTDSHLNYPFDPTYLNRQEVETHKFNATWPTHAIETIWPLKFPPEQFYIDQIIKVSQLFKENETLFVTIITDEKNPKSLVERVKKSCNKKNINFYYHDNRALSHTERIVQDLFLLSQCDILIRPDSAFSKSAQILGYHKLVLNPIEFIWLKPLLMISKIAISGSQKDWIKKITGN